MYKFLSITVTFFLFSCYSYSQKSKLDFNLGFEEFHTQLPAGYKKMGDKEFKIFCDSTDVKSGQYSLSIQNHSFATFGAASMAIPYSYRGKSIKLSGFIKTEDVTGYCGLWLRLDPSLGFDNMQDQNIKGTRDWTEFEVELEMSPNETKQIVFGVLLVGTGKIWVDDLKITIDGKPIWKATVLEKELFPADLDSTFTQNSLVKNISVQSTTVANLAVLGKVWGFLKYYHPQIMTGQYNWDYELFRFLPQYLEVTTSEERDLLLVDWVHGLGEFDRLKKIKFPDSTNVKMYPDLDWMTTSGFSSDLELILENVKMAKRPSSGYYYAMNGVGGANILNENAYAKMEYSDAGMRLLSLYRYWNIIQYLSPYKYTIEEDWQAVLEAFIPEYLNANDELSYEETVAKLIVRTKDTHAAFRKSDSELHASFGVRIPAFEVTYIENKPVVTCIYDPHKIGSSGLEVGDEINAVNDVSMEEKLQQLLPYTSGSNYPTQLRDVAGKLLCSNDTEITIKFKSGEVMKEVVLKTFKPNELNVRSHFSGSDTCFKLLAGNIGYIDNGALKKSELPELWESFKNTDGLIIDNRNYPSDFALYGMSALLLGEKVPFAIYTMVSVQQPGLFQFTEKGGFVGEKNKDAYLGKVIILVNETSQSSSEFHAMAYRTVPGSLVVGSTTAGADGNVTSLVLPGKIRSRITGIGIYYPNRSETQRVGIVPDVEVKPTITGIKEGRDEVLEIAIQLILNAN